MSNRMNFFWSQRAANGLNAILGDGAKETSEGMAVGVHTYQRMYEAAIDTWYQIFKTLEENQLLTMEMVILVKEDLSKNLGLENSLVNDFMNRLIEKAAKHGS